jgi:hypothetical protein
MAGGACNEAEASMLLCDRAGKVEAGKLGRLGRWDAGKRTDTAGAERSGGWVSRSAH